VGQLEQRREAIRQAMRDWGMDCRDLQRDEQLPTGRVTVRFVDGEPAYEIVAPCAYDRIETPHQGAAGRLDGHRHQVGFLLPIQFALFPRPGPVIEGTLQPSFYETLAHPADRRGAYHQSFGHLQVGEPFIGFAQDQGPFHFARRRFTPAGYLQQMLPLVSGQVHQVLFSRHSPHLPATKRMPALYLFLN